MKKNLIVIICTGIPASGKSTWSKEYIKKHPNFVRINRDDYRYMLKDAGMTEPKIENMISGLVQHAIDVALAANLNVIVDNTHVKASYLNELVAYVEHRADVEFMLFDISLDKAIERDAARPNPVGEVVINRMYKDWVILLDSYVFQNQSKKKYVYKEPVKNPLLPTVVVFDLDGTLAHNNGKRGYFDWDKCDNDDLDETMMRIYKRHYFNNEKVIIVTGRSEEARKSTTEWLDFYGIKHEALLMRKAEDFRKDNVVKREIYMEHIHEKFNVEVVYDDRQSVVDMWRSLGLKTLQVEKGYH